jgi:RecA/RadA recombinase
MSRPYCISRLRHKPIMGRRGEQITAEPAPDDEDISSFAQDSGPSRFDQMSAVGSRFKDWRPAREVLRPVRGLRTRFPQFDRVTRVGGLPWQRFITVHGPSNHGKTILTCGLGASALEAGNFFFLIDAERTTTITWMEELMGGLADHPGFHALRPDNYEQAVDMVRSSALEIAEARDKGELPPNTGAMYLVDSFRKLNPKGLLKRLLAETGGDDDEEPKPGGGKPRKKPGGVDGYGGMSGRVKAGLHAQWLDELVPLMDKTGCTFVGIARESEGDTNDVYDYKVGGGKALIYDASLVLRVVRASYITHGSEANSPVYGERHRIELRKTKIAGKDEKVPRCYFHTSNGNLIPPGFDRARDVLELALMYGIINTSGTHRSWHGRRWQGEHQGVKMFTGNPEMLRALETEVRARFSPDEDLPDISDEDARGECRVSQD